MTIKALADRYWSDILALDPILATQVGDERFDDRLPDPSLEGIAHKRAVHSAALDQVGRLRESATDQSDRAICDVVEAIARPELAAIDLGMFRFAPINHLSGPGTLLEELGSIQRTNTAEQLTRYSHRLESLPAYLQACGEILLKGTDQPTGPALVVDRCIRQVEELLASDPENSPALRPIPADDAHARSRVVDLIRARVLPAYARYLDDLRVCRARARTTIGLHDLPKGDQMYQVCIERWTSLSRDPREVHEIGRADLQKVQAERLALARQLGSDDPAEAVAAHVASGKNSFQSREEIVQLAREQVERGWDRAPQFFGRRPQRNCEVRPIDESRENYMLEYYMPGTADGSRPGVYYVNTAKPQQRQRHSLASTTFHESNPGHHFQIALERDQKDRPALLQFGGELASSAFIEGWGLYAERLADEMGLFIDSYERLGMLQAQGVRAARLVVDTGLHALGWTRDQVIQTLASTGLEPGRCAIEADRYIAMPGQALAYKIGQIEIETARRRAEQESGSAFSLSGFHDRVLALGSVPLTTFRRELSSWSHADRLSMS